MIYTQVFVFQMCFPLSGQHSELNEVQMQWVFFSKYLLSVWLSVKWWNVGGLNIEYFLQPQKWSIFSPLKRRKRPWPSFSTFKIQWNRNTIAMLPCKPTYALSRPTKCGCRPCTCVIHQVFFIENSQLQQVQYLLCAQGNKLCAWSCHSCVYGVCVCVCVCVWCVCVWCYLYIFGGNYN